ncbi:MAG: tetratricopeptide repeat protein [Bacteroidota bacterium]
MQIKKTPITKHLVAVAFFLIPLLMTGCGLWNNFTAYFNVYYNAARKFQEAEQQIQDQKRALFTIQEAKPTGAASDNLTKVIEKLSKLLQFSSESDLVDDALLMIGKSFYYQQDYQKALRKFTELISTFPKSDLALEAQLWIGKSQLRIKNFSQASTVLSQVRAAAEEKGDKDIMVQVYIEQISYLIAQEKYDEAVANGLQLVKTSDDDQMNANVMYELGKLYLKINKPEDAAKAFAEVQNYDPTYDIEYGAKLQYGKVQRKLGNFEPALEIFRDIDDEAKYNAYRDSTELQIGLTYIDLKRYDDAFSQLRLVDTSYKQSPNSGVAQFYLGEMMETHYADYDSANYYYRRAMSSAAPYDITQKANRKMQVLTKYANLHAQISQLDKQLAYINHPELFVQDSVAYLKEAAKLDSLMKERANQTTQQTDDAVQNNRRGDRRDLNDPQLAQLQAQQKKPFPKRPVVTADSIKSGLARNEYELGSLFFTELNIPDSAYFYYSHLIENYPAAPLVPRALYALGSYYLTKNNKAKADSLFQVIYDNYKSEKVVNAAAEKLGKPTINLDYDAAEDLFIEAEKKLKAEQYRDAVSELKEIPVKYPKSAFAPKALYTTGWIFENKLKMLDTAAAVYDSVIVKYPATVYANAIRGKINVYNEEQKKLKASRDSANAANNPVKAQAPQDSVKNGVQNPNNQNANGQNINGQNPNNQQNAVPQIKPGPGQNSPQPNDTTKGASSTVPPKHVMPPQSTPPVINPPAVTPPTAKDSAKVTVPVTDSLKTGGQKNSKDKKKNTIEK